MGRPAKNTSTNVVCGSVRLSNPLGAELDLMADSAPAGNDAGGNNERHKAQTSAWRKAGAIRAFTSRDFHEDMRRSNINLVFYINKLNKQVEPVMLIKRLTQKPSPGNFFPWNYYCGVTIKLSVPEYAPAGTLAISTPSIRTSTTCLPFLQ